MDIITYLGIALLHMRNDAFNTRRAKVHYNWSQSLILSVIWPITDIILIIGIIWKNIP